MPTVDLNNLTGVWEPFFTRRLGLHADAIETMRDLWLGLRPDWSRLVDDARKSAGLAYETVAPVDPEVLATLTAMVSKVVKDADMAAALALNIANAEAEGWTGGLALAADAGGALTFDWDLAFTHAHDALRNLDQIHAVALSTSKSIGDSTLTDLGRVLANQLDAGATYADMIQALDSAWDDANALAYWVDVAMSAGLSQGALDLYTSEGVKSYDWVTAGDQRVCAICEGNEESNPWPADSPEVPPAHGRCRCVITANESLPASVWAPYTNEGASDG